MSLFVLAVIVIGASILYALVGATVVRRAMQGRVREGHNDVLVPIFLTAGTIYAVLLAFLVIAVWESYGAASDNAAEEASTLTTLYRQTNGLPPAPQKELRELIRDYTERVKTDEWPTQAASGTASPLARRAIGNIYRAYSTMNPKDAASPVGIEFLQTMRTVANDRNRRTMQAAEQLPPILWVVLLVGAAIIVGMSFFLYMDVAWPQVLFSSLMAGLIGTLLFITLLLNKPFAGPLGIASEPFEHSLSVYDSVDQGN
jgi:phosphate/sulfate permease